MQAALAALAAAGSPHLKYMSFYGMDPAVQRGWLNLNSEGGLSEKLSVWEQYKIPSLYGGLPSGIFIRGKGLESGWEAVLNRTVVDDILPNYGPGKALRGVFLGDEICCSNTSCWDTALAPVAAKLKSMLGNESIIYTNECASSAGEISKVPAGFDLISADIYRGYLPATSGKEEVTAAKKVYEKLFKALQPGQQVLLVPGTFACSDVKFFPLKDQSKNVVEKLQAYFDWAKEEPLIAGFNPWHFNNRSTKQHGPPCDMELGAVAMPDVVSTLAEIGKYIVNASSF
eukprot:TRINITY_DN36218_c0_g1_i1.p1 TRINITY_DN36218_c0_g1~~TRINITY_DN36218_c0_g1_i1.p1  ORF type:complete len:303 (+),score=119.28 TRINITY_DN36218_c0_g1_i1:54-911(+)